MRVKLGDVFEIGSGGTPSKSHPEYYGGDIPWVKTGDLKSEYLYEVEDFITEAGLNNSSAKMYEPDTVLIAMYGATIGATTILKMHACTNQACAAFKKNDSVIPEYLYFFLKSQKEKFVKDGVGGAQPNISAGYLKKVEMELPSLNEQREIVNILDKITDVLNKRNQEIQKLDELIKARFVELFGEQELNPYGFEKTTIGECCTLKSGTSLPSDKENEGGDIPYIKVGDMNYPGNERYITTSSRYVTEETAGKGLFDIGSIIFPKRGGAIGTNKKRMTLLPICADLNVMGVSSNGKLMPEYLLTYFDMIDMSSLSDGSSVPQINNKNIAPLEILLPPMKLQNQFAEFVKQVDKSKVEVQKVLERTQFLFDSLMQKYFGG